MKLSIQLEVTTEEVPFITDLLSALRLLTDHAKASPPSVVVTDEKPAPPPAATAATPPAPSPPAPAPVKPPAPVAPPKPTRELLEELILKLNTDQAAQALDQLLAVVQDESRGPPEAVTEQLVEACLAVIFNTENIINRGVAPYLTFLPKLPDHLRGKVKDAIIKKVLSQLTKKRPVDSVRSEFFGAADAFAVLVLEQYIPIDGAVQSVQRLLLKPDTRAAAVTMLGKTVEYCHAQLEAANPVHLEALKNALGGVAEPVFQYDIGYITSTMHWPAPGQVPPPGPQPKSPGPTSAPAHLENHHAPSAAPPASRSTASPAATSAPTAAESAAAAAPAPSITQLIPLTHFPPQTQTVFALSHSAVTHDLACGGREDVVTVYNNAGELSHRPHVPYGNMVVSMDHHPKHNMLAICGVTEDANSLPSIALYDASNSYVERSTCSKPAGTIMTCIRTFSAGSDQLVAAESIAAGGPKNLELLCIYDLARLSGGEQLQPVATFDQHSDLITCVATFPNSPHTFVSGSRDCTVRMWDLRQSGSATGLFSAPNSGGYAHTQMVTSLDCIDNLVVSAGQDSALCVWDPRMMATNVSADGGPGPLCAMQVDGSVLLRVALRGAPHPNLVAVASVMGLCLVDFSNPQAPVRVAASLFPDAQDGAFSLYHDIKWAGGHPLLYAAGDSMRVDVFQAA